MHIVWYHVYKIQTYKKQYYALFMGLYLGSKSPKPAQTLPTHWEVLLWKRV